MFVFVHILPKFDICFHTYHTFGSADITKFSLILIRKDIIIYNVEIIFCIGMFYEFISIFFFNH